MALREGLPRCNKWALDLRISRPRVAVAAGHFVQVGQHPVTAVCVYLPQGAVSAGIGLDGCNFALVARFGSQMAFGEHLRWAEAHRSRENREGKSYFNASPRPTVLLLHDFLQAPQSRF